jgi:hypothetical protein
MIPSSFDRMASPFLSTENGRINNGRLRIHFSCHDVHVDLVFIAVEQSKSLTIAIALKHVARFLL